MTKKNWIILGVSLGVVTAFSIGIGVSVALVNPTKIYEINIKSKTDSRYLVTVMNTQQNKADFTSKDIFDIIDDDESKKIVASFLEIDRDNVVATISISNKDKYKNGLEKLIYDLIRAKKNGPKLIIKSQKRSIEFDKAFLDMPYSNTTEQKNKLVIIKTKLKELFLDVKKDSKGKVSTPEIYIIKNNGVTKLTQALLDESVKNIENKFS